MCLDAQEWVVGSEGAEPRQRVVGRAVVQGDDLKVMESLRRKAVEAAAEVFAGVVNGN
ncbi:MAG: hypothetical protein IKO40_12775 [Kiritimatiellae bacterium]|nr:hypothetical protein [Kiritimatiellia bacterium]